MDGGEYTSIWPFMARTMEGFFFEAPMTSKLDALAQSETKKFHQRSSEWFLNCAVNLMAVDFKPDVVAEKLEALAKHIREHQ